MKLSGQQRKNLQQALLDAFPSKSLLEQMLSFELNKSLNEIAEGGSLQEIVFSLIITAEAQGWVQDLVDAALLSNPGNSLLKNIALELLPNTSTETINIDSQSFEFYITIPSGYDYWQESSKPIREQYPFEYPCKQYFHLNKDFFVENIHPCFDITFLNKKNEFILLTHVGIEIVSVCHLVYDYGTPESIEVKIQSSQIISMPDIIARLGNQHMRHSYLKPPPPVNLYEVISVKMSSPFYLQHQAPFRYTLLLEKYQEHMPNNAILRMWAKTSNGIEFRSHDIHLFTL